MVMVIMVVVVVEGGEFVDTLETRARALPDGLVKLAFQDQLALRDSEVLEGGDTAGGNACANR